VGRDLHTHREAGAENLQASGEPEAAFALESPDARSPTALAFDSAGNLWVADSGGAVVKFAGSRLAARSDDRSADVVIFAQQPAP